MKKIVSVSIVTIYLLAFSITLGVLSYNLVNGEMGKFECFRLLFSCILIGGAGGILYCLRGAYLNYCVWDRWADKWILWYITRPAVSMICGGVSYIFLKAGLLVLEAQKEAEATNLGFYALAFIAGMNVDNFISKIEDLADATWGIKKSRTTRDTQQSNQ